MLTKIVITVPHDAPEGTGESASFIRRPSGQFKRDVATAAIAIDIIASLPAATMIRGQLPRTLVDFNRAPAAAFCDTRLESDYNQYHVAIENLLDKETLLVDLHGFLSGEGEGRDFDLLISSCGDPIGQAISDVLVELGYLVLYDDGSTGQGASIMTAGYTVQRYSAMGFHAVQVEISDKYRQTKTRELGLKLSRDLALSLRGSLPFDRSLIS